MRSVAPMKAAKAGYIIVSAAMCVLGVLLMAFPEFTVSMIGAVCGIIFIVFGIVRLIGFFSKDLYRLAFQYDLAFGVLTVALGIIMLTRRSSLMDFICISVGLLILADGLFKIQMSMESRRFGIERWWLILSFAVISAAFGLTLIIRPSDGGHVLSVLMGITLFSSITSMQCFWFR